MLGNFRKYIINILLIVLFAGGALYLVLKDNWDNVVVLLQELELYHILFIFAYAFIFIIVGGVILYLIARSFGYKYTLAKGISNNLVGTFFSGVTPGASGGQIGQIYVFRKQGIDIADGGSILWYDFIVYQCVMIIYVLVLLLLKFGHYYQQYSAFYFIILLGFIAQSFVVVFLFTMVIFPQVYVKFINKGLDFLAKFHLIKNKQRLQERIEFEVSNFKAKSKLFKHKKLLLVQVICLNILKLTIYYSVPILIAYAFGIDLTPDQYIEVIALTAFVSMANAFIPIPGASGGTESVFTFIFSNLFGLNIAGALMIVWRFITYYCMVIIGGITFLIIQIYYYSKQG